MATHSHTYTFLFLLNPLSLHTPPPQSLLSTADVAATTAAIAKVTVAPAAKPSPPVPKAAPTPAAAPPADEDDGDAAELMDGENDVEVGGEKSAAGVVDQREHLNVIHIGHVDSGKSTLSGSILFHTGQIDARTIEKFEREAKQRGRESWWLAYILDTTEEERSKGITVEVGRATFSTPNKRFTILDAPGHKSFVANMIAGAAQADIGVLVISARKGEFETGFEKGGQTREHAMLAKTLGVRVLVVVVNKMDDNSVKWEQPRYDEIVGKLTPFLKQSGYNVAKHVHFIPIAAITGANVKERAGATCPWYTGPSLLELLDSISIGGRDPEAPLRVPLVDKYIDRGIIAMGKVEAGTVREGMEIVIMPQNTKARVEKVYIDDVEATFARPGENVKIKIKGCAEDDVLKGFVLCERVNPVLAVTQFEAQIMVMELDHRALFTAGYSAVLHIHTAEEECTVVKLVAELDKKTGEPKPGPPPRYVKSGALCVAIIKVARSICVEKFDVLQQMGRFTLRDEGRTLGIGKVLRLGVPRAPPAAKGSSSSGAAAGGGGGGGGVAAGGGGGGGGGATE